MPLYRGSVEQEALFERLVAEGGGRTGNWSCSVQGGNQHMLVLIMERAQGKELFAAAGSPDKIVADFKVWLESNHTVT